jgi:stage V sporulation protein B
VAGLCKEEKGLSKDSLLKGTIILTAAAFVARFLGMVQRIPLKHLLQDSGMGTYGITYNIYFILFTIATAGLPSAVAKLVSERMELGREAEAERIFRAAVWFALISGFIMSIFLYFYAPFQASFSQDANAVGPIRAIAPSLLLFPLAAVIRGYFQGRQHMLPNGLSQIFEQVLRVLTSVALAAVFLAIGWGQNWAVTGASFGGVLGTVGAVLVLLYYLARMRQEDRDRVLGSSERAQGTVVELRYRDIYKTLFAIAFPVVLFGATVPTINWIDSSIIKPLISGQIGDKAAQDVLGQLSGRAQSMAGLPIVLAIAISQSIVPIISSAYAKKDMGLVARQAGKALQLAVLSGLPLVLMVATAARPLNSLAFKDAQGTSLIVMLTVIAMFQILMQTSGAILMGIGAMRPLSYYMLAGIAVKLASSYALAPFFGVYGVVAGTGICFIVMAWLIHRSLKKRIPDYRIFTGGVWRRLLLSAVIITAVGTAAEMVTHRWIHLPYRLDYLLQSGIVCGIVVLLYPVMIGLTRVVTREDLKTYPASVQRLLAKLFRFVGVRL